MRGLKLFLGGGGEEGGGEGGAAGGESLINFKKEGIFELKMLCVEVLKNALHIIWINKPLIRVLLNAI